MELFEAIPQEHKEILLKLFLSVLLGAIIGLERQMTNKSAGLRTQILVCLGSAIFTILSIHGFDFFGANNTLLRNEPSRVAAQILTGIGFIGGGVILKSEGSVYGITTAASLWVVASIGMAVGAGSYFLAMLGTLLAVTVLLFIRTVEKRYIDIHTKKESKVKIELETRFENISKIDEMIRDRFVELSEVHFLSSPEEKEIVRLDFVLKVQSSNPINDVFHHLREIQNLASMTVKHIDTHSD